MNHLRYAGFWRRAVAFWIDSAILNAVATVFLMGYLGVLGVSVTDVGGITMQMMGVGAYACFAFPYYTIAHYRWGFTLGKRLMRVRVVPNIRHRLVEQTTARGIRVHDLASMVWR